MATARAVAKVNMLALEAWLADPGPTKVLGEIAMGIRDAAVQAAPEHTGYYRRRMQARPYRTWWRVENVDPFAHLVEWGSINNPAYAPVRIAIRQSDLKFKAGPKG